MTAVQPAPADTGQPDRTRRWADIIDRYVWDRHGPENAAIRLQAEDDIREALAAVDLLADARHTLDQLRLRHHPVPIADGHTHHVCAHDRREWPCPDGELLWG